MRRSKRPKTASKEWSNLGEIIIIVLFIGFAALFFIASVVSYLSGQSGTFNGVEYEGTPLIAMLLSGTFVVIGIGVLLLTLKKSAKKENASYSPHATQQNNQILASSETTKSTFGFLLLFSIFWLTITTFGAFADDVPIWLIALFYLVGIGLLGLALWEGMALLNPKIVFVVHKGHLTTGDTVSVSWQIKGRTSALQDMSIQFIGYESASYFQGTDTATETHRFHNKTFNIPEIEFRAHRGTLEITIPNHTMHSWKSRNNAIVWALEVEGEMRMWRNLNETHEMTIYPNKKQ